MGDPQNEEDTESEGNEEQAEQPEEEELQTRPQKKIVRSQYNFRPKRGEIYKKKLKPRKKKVKKEVVIKPTRVLRSRSKVMEDVQQTNVDVKTKDDDEKKPAEEPVNQSFDQQPLSLPKWAAPTLKKVFRHLMNSDANPVRVFPKKPLSSFQYFVKDHQWQADKAKDKWSKMTQAKK